MKLVETLRRRSPSSPEPADIRRVIAGSIGVCLGLIAHTIVIGRSDWLLFLHLASIMVFGVLAVGLALPAYLLWGLRGDWRRFTVWCGKGLLVVTSVLFLGAGYRAIREQPVGRIRSTERIQSTRRVGWLQEGRMSIPAFLRAERAWSPEVFDRRVVDGFRSSFSEWGIEDADVSFAGATDSDASMRLHLTYRLPAHAETGEPLRTGHFVLQYHASGMAILSAVCSPDVRESCPRADRILADAEGALKGRLSASDLDGVLPAPVECSTEAIQVPGGEDRAIVRLCSYEPDVQVTLQRSDAASTIAELIAGRDP